MDFTLTEESLSFTLASAEALSFELSNGNDIEFTLTTPSQIGVDNYEGPYEVTPSANEQILNTRNLRTTDNITISAIPENYGLITWDGAKLKVS